MNGWPFARTRRWGDGSLRYSRRNIREWLLYYPQIFDSSEASSSLCLAEVKADVDLAIGELSPHIREFFRLYCLEQRELSEIIQARKWSAETCDRYWRELVGGVCARLCDQEMYEMSEEELDDLPPFCSSLWVVPWTDHI